MSKTPRTDKATTRLEYGTGAIGDFVPANIAKELEEELIETQERFRDVLVDVLGLRYTQLWR